MTVFYTPLSISAITLALEPVWRRVVRGAFFTKSKNGWNDKHDRFLLRHMDWPMSMAWEADNICRFKLSIRSFRLVFLYRFPPNFGASRTQGLCETQVIFFETFKTITINVVCYHVLFALLFWKHSFKSVLIKNIVWCSVISNSLRDTSLNDYNQPSVISGAQLYLNW